MLTPLRPLTDAFPLAYPRDPAFDVNRKDFAEEWRRCATTFDYAPLTLPAQQPTLFWFRHLEGSTLRRLRAAVPPDMLPWLAVRVALERVEHGGELDQVDRLVDGLFPLLGLIVTEKYMNVLEAVSQKLGRLTGELIDIFGAIVLDRSVAPSPLS